MELKPINRICPRCGNGNYMRIIDGKNVGKLNVKCINCNSYYNYDELLKKDNSKPLNGADGRTMDDLISRAAAIAWFFRPYSNEEYYSNIDVERALKAITAVDAIPVEWLEDKELDYRTIGDKMFSDAFAVVIGEWQKEQEAR